MSAVSDRAAPELLNGDSNVEIHPVLGITIQRLRLVNREGKTRLTPELMDRLAGMLSNQACVITLEGTPGSFCEGLDVESLPRPAPGRRLEGESDDYLSRFAELVETIQRIDRPVIALVDGPALGGGLGLAAAADVVLATPRSSFALPETLLGLIPAVAFPVVARRIGVSKASVLALGAQTLSAQAACEIGLVDELVDDLSAAFTRYARRLSRMDPGAIGQLKNLVATFFAPPPGYMQAATTGFYELLHSDTTQSRLERFAGGETPWPESA